MDYSSPLPWLSVNSELPGYLYPSDSDTSDEKSYVLMEITMRSEKESTKTLRDISHAIHKRHHSYLGKPYFEETCVGSKFVIHLNGLEYVPTMW